MGMRVCGVAVRWEADIWPHGGQVVISDKLWAAQHFPVGGRQTNDRQRALR